MLSILIQSWSIRRTKHKVSALIGIALAAVILIVLIFPFVKRNRQDHTGIDQVDRVASADTLRHILYREPVTLRNEFESGNISIEEYEDQIGELRMEAARLMRERSEHRQRLLEAELALETEVQRVRKLRDNDETQDDAENA